MHKIDLTDEVMVLNSAGRPRSDGNSRVTGEIDE
jgi:hypothetical protein